MIQSDDGTLFVAVASQLWAPSTQNSLALPHLPPAEGGCEGALVWLVQDAIRSALPHHLWAARKGAGTPECVRQNADFWVPAESRALGEHK